jgi:hypothetical protein
VTEPIIQWYRRKEEERQQRRLERYGAGSWRQLATMIGRPLTNGLRALYKLTKEQPSRNNEKEQE